MKRTFYSLLSGICLLWVLVLGACAAPSSRTGGFESNNPATLLYAIQEAGEARDESKIPNLVEALQNDDPAVRMMAIGALERITGQRMGYNPYGSSIDRAPAVARWHAMVNGEVPALAEKQNQRLTSTTLDDVNPQ